jgi:uncharacterized SAM-binding protein YcdF (DUF218 family)
MVTESRVVVGGACRARGRLAKRVLVFLVVVVVICAVAWFDRRFFLRAAVDLWAVSDTVTAADAVAVLGGGTDTRPFAAAAYYKRGLVKKVLVSNVHVAAAISGIVASETDLDRSVLIKLGVPEEAIELFGTDLSSTYEEAVALRAWLLRTHAHSLIVPTEYFASRRVRWIIVRELNGTGAQVEVPAMDDPEYPRTEWWRNDKGLVEFQNEVIKYIYYRIKY